MPIIVLAPMAGITDWPFRLLCFEQGCDSATTEMVSAMGYICSRKELNVYRFLLETHPGEGPVSVQIFGADARIMSDTAKLLTSLGRFSSININMGCPAHKVVSSGSGSALMRDPVLAEEIMRAVKLSTDLPVSVKFRLGWNSTSINVCELAHIAQENGISHIIVHGRTREQQFSGKADLEAIARVKNIVSIPVFANGDVFTAHDAIEMLRETMCDGICIGRGALGNPWLFYQIKAAIGGRSTPLPTVSQVINTAMRHTDLMVSWKGEDSAILEMRKHLSWYIRGIYGASQLRTQINTAKTINEVKALLENFAERFEKSNQTN